MPPRLLVALVASWIFALSVTAGAALRVELATGRTLEATAVDWKPPRARITLPGGGELELATSGIVAIDEVPETDEVADEVAAAPVRQVVTTPELRPILFEPTAFDDWIDGLAARHGVDPNLVRAVVRAESGADPAARSKRGALGLMQLMQGTAAELGCSNRLDPVANLDCGIRYLAALLERFDGDLARALAAYNAGPAAVERHGGIPPFAETEAYVRRILEWLGVPR